MQKKTPKKVVLRKKTTLPSEWKEVVDAFDERVARHTGALYEQFQGQVSAVAEQFLGLNEKVDHMNETLNSHTEMIGGIKEDIEIIKTDIELLKSGLRVKVDYKDFEALERRMRLVESKLRR